ncbi:MAG: trimethylamine methyltransferase family protein [Dehalobacterium sp.]
MIRGGMETDVLKILREDEINKIHKATVRVLSEVGVQITDKAALEYFSGKGVRTDDIKNRIYLTEADIMQGVGTAPSEVILYGRGNDAHNIIIGGKKVYTGTGGTAINIIDFDRKRRKTTTGDIAQTAKLVDGLNNVHFFVIPCHPSNVDNADVDVNRFYHAINNTTKHIMGGVLTEKGLDQVIEMAAEIAGGMDQLRDKPFISFILSTISPLKFDDQALRNLFKAAKLGLPVAPSCAPISGATAPITLAGTIVQLNAEALAGVVLTQLINPGAPVLYCAVPTIMDMRSMAFLFGSVESGLMNAAMAQMAQFYKLPLYSTGGISDAKEPDQQAGFEKGISCILPALAGANFIHEAAGQLDGGMTISYAQYVIDNDINGYVLRAVRGIETDEKSLAIENIIGVGPGGNFLDQELTVEKMRTEFYYPTAINRMSYDNWEKAGKKNTWSLAEECARKVLETHKPNHIPEEMRKEILNKYPQIIE